MNSLHVSKFACAVSGAVVVFYILCVAVVALAPEFASSLWTSLAHVSATEARVVTMSGAIIGAIQVLVYSYLVGWLIATFYNSCGKSNR